METHAVDEQNASNALAEALKTMDSILAGTLKREHKSQNGVVASGCGSVTGSPKLQNSRAIKLLNDIQALLADPEDRWRIYRHLKPETQHFFQQWISECGHDTYNNGQNGSSQRLEDKVRKLEADKDNLTLQVSVLSDQIEAQVEKIRDLERSLRISHSNKSSVNGHREELLPHNMPGQDVHKLDLMAENSSLKLRLAALERDKADLESRLQYAQIRIEDLQSRLNEQTLEMQELRMHISKTNTAPSSPNLSDVGHDRTLERERTLERLKRKHSEVEKLKKAVESLMVTNTEKDQHIEDLTKEVKKYKRLEELSEIGSKHQDNYTPETNHNNKTGYNSMDRSHKDINNALLPNATSTPVSGMNTIPHTPRPGEPPHTQTTVGIGRSSSCENVKAKNTPPLIRGQNTGYGAQSETDEEALKDEMAQEYKQLQRQNADNVKKHKNKGIRRFFGKLRRSNSQEIDVEKLGDFKRSGLRATAGARLIWSKDLKNIDTEIPFPHWDTDRVAAWLHALGLSMYVGDCKRWVKNGEHLLSATPQDLEKELGIRNHFHRKKLILALQAVGSENKSAMDNLDYNWVTRWLDDIGLPQYKDYFLDARIDGRMLHYMTVDDLVALKVVNTLHHLSIRRGIQVLRLNDFNPACLKRRPLPQEGNLTNVPKEVMLWTNHRVMEWLRSIDLSEYAPNLRGSGVHGGLMALEPRFSHEIFASLLSIPSNKTLLRRHLSTHYVSLIGPDVQQKKREIQSEPGYIPLTPNQKVKVKKRLFSHRRTRSESNDEELVCPIDGEQNGNIGINGLSNSNHVWNKGTVTDRDNKENMLARDRFLENVPTSDV